MKKLFHVYDLGEVRAADFDDPEVYLDLCENLPADWHVSKNKFLEAIRLDDTFSKIIDRIYESECDEIEHDSTNMSVSAPPSLESWIQGMSDDYFGDEFKTRVEDYLHENIEDYDELPLESTSLGMAILYFTKLDSNVLDQLDIVEIHGDRPGSNYHGMELRNTVEKANSIAKNLGLDIEFVQANW